MPTGKPNPWGSIEALRARGMDKWTYVGPADILPLLDELVGALGKVDKNIKSRSDVVAFLCREGHARIVKKTKKGAPRDG